MQCDRNKCIQFRCSIFLLNVGCTNVLNSQPRALCGVYTKRRILQHWKEFQNIPKSKRAQNKGEEKLSYICAKEKGKRLPERSIEHVDLCTWKGFSGSSVSFATSKEERKGQERSDWRQHKGGTSAPLRSLPVPAGRVWCATFICPWLTPTLNVHSSQSNHSLIVYFLCVFSGSDCILCLDSLYLHAASNFSLWSENSICGRAWDAAQWCSMCVRTVCKALGSNPSITTKEDSSRLFSQIPPRPGGLCL